MDAAKGGCTRPVGSSLRRIRLQTTPLAEMITHKPGGGYRMGVQLVGSCKHTVGYDTMSLGSEELASTAVITVREGLTGPAVTFCLFFGSAPLLPVPAATAAAAATAWTC